jgi:Tol biopolymer transport system component
MASFLARALGLTPITPPPPTTPPPATLKKMVFKDGDHLYSMFSDGSGRKALTSGNGSEWYPEWSPDGSKILHRRFIPSEDGGLFVMNADGSIPVRILDDPNVFEADWSPDGRNIVFVSKRDSANSPATSCSGLFCPTNLFILNLGTGSIRQLTFHDAINWEPAWSPNGTKIAFTSDLDNDWEIFTINVNGTGLTQVTFNEEGDGAAAWLPDSSGVVHRGYIGGQSELWLTRFGHEEQRLTNNPSRDDYPAVATDGTVAFARRQAFNYPWKIVLLAVNGQEVGTGQNGLDPDWRP